MNQKFVFCIVFLILLCCDIFISNAETAQYYNETSGQMEVPIMSIGSTKTDNYISFCSLENTNLTVFDDVVVNWDKVSRVYPNGTIVTAYNYGGVWYGNVGDVEPIEAGIGYVYERAASAGNTTWTYDTEFYCEECNGTVDNNMDIILFLFFIFVALFLSFVSYFIPGGIGLGLAWLGGAMMILTAIKIGTGEAITIVSNGSVVALDIGLDRSHIFILFILFAILIIVSNSYIVLIRGIK